LYEIMGYHGIVFGLAKVSRGILLLKTVINNART
jgi:hypothetical protein